jgi:hypothetical protein
MKVNSNQYRDASTIHAKKKIPYVNSWKLEQCPCDEVTNTSGSVGGTGEHILEFLASGVDGTAVHPVPVT